MNIKTIFLFLFPIFLSCNTPKQKNTELNENIIYQIKDKEILEQVFDIFQEDKNIPIPVLMIKVGTFFKETPYVASTLEISPDEEKLIINLREMDCTTFAENCLAISRCIKNGKNSFEDFTSELQKIRYRDGKIDDYTSRLHYFSDWIFDNNKKKIIKSVSSEISENRYSKTIDFISTHPESYQQLKENTDFVEKIKIQEKEITARENFFIPEEKLVEVEDKLMDGDIVGITTGIKGLDIVHVGILVRKGGRIHLMHASSAAEKVIVSEETLEEYLLNSKNATGIMVARPL